MKHANSILETFEYSCQKSSKSITIILSYTVSKLVRFLRHSVELLETDRQTDRHKLIQHKNEIKTHIKRGSLRQRKYTEIQSVIDYIQCTMDSYKRICT